MLNYLKAELYKLLRQRSFCVSLSLLILLEGLLTVLMRVTGSGWTFNESVLLLCGILPIGFFMILPLGGLVFSEQYKHRTLKNEICFGLSRERIYLGKLLAEAVACTAACVLAVAFFLGFSLLLCPVAPGDGLSANLSLLGYCLLMALPVWLGALGLLHAIQFTVKNTPAAVILYGAFFFVVEPTVYMLSELNERFHNTFFPALRLGLLSTPLENLSGSLGPERMGWAWLVGLGWLFLTSIIGLMIFQKRDMI